MYCSESNLAGHWRGGEHRGGGGGEAGGGLGRGVWGRGGVDGDGGRGRGWGRGGGRGNNKEMDRPWVTPGLRQEILKTKVTILNSFLILRKYSLRAWQVLPERQSQRRLWQLLESSKRRLKHCWRKQR